MAVAFGNWLGQSISLSSGRQPTGSQVKRIVLVALLLVLPYFAMMWVPFYNRAAPEIAGIPFFYWYQLMWIPLGSVLLLLAYLMWRPIDPEK
jgi:hypothetical protein